MAVGEDVARIVGLLADVADGDTVYRDVYLRRARARLSQDFSESAYRDLGALEARVNGLLGESRAAAFRREWARAAQLAGQAEAMRATMAARSGLADVAKRVYDASAIALDPFSPGLPGASGSRQREQMLLAEILEKFRTLAGADPSLASFYESRRAYFSRLSAAAPGERSETSTPAQLEQLAFEAARRGDAARLRQLATELLREGEAAGTAPGSGAWAPHECPVSLDVAFPEDAVARARALGFASARSAPLLDLSSLRDLIYSYAWQPGPADEEREEEGVVRAQKLVAAEKLPPDVTEHLKILAGQFVMHTFVNSGGARYLPSLATEVALIEDFSETEAANAKPELIHALGLPRRTGLARVEIEGALAREGAPILERLGLDPLEFRLVCIPYDLYTRLGQSRGWGQGDRWTHFDGYQAMHTGRLRALAGGNSRFGGLLDLVSINATDARETALARFAVVRRVRMVARWA